MSAVGPQSPESRWAPVKRSNLSDEIADRIIGYILKGEFQFGEKLPAERDLATYLGVGRPTVREALRTLTVIGMVEVRPGEGTFVVSHHADFVARAFSWAVLLDPQTTLEVVEARSAIETELAGLAAERITENESAELRAIVTRMEQHIGDRGAFSDADLEFHLSIAKAARNVTLARLLSATQSLLTQWIQRALESPSTFGMALEHHRAILAAIDSGDAAEARQAMRRHVLEMGALVTSASADAV